MQLLRSIYKSWRRNAFRTLITDDYRSWRGLDLQVASWHIAKQIQTKKPSVAILLPTSGLFPVALTAIWSLGKTVVPLNYLLSKKEILYIIEDSGVDLVITVGAMLDMIGDLPDGVQALKLDEMSFKGFPPFRSSVKSDGDMLAALLYTSGTSGNPKGVMLTADNLQSNIDQCISKVGFSKKDIFIGLLPQFHSFGFTVTTLLPCVIGSKTVYLARFNPRKVLEILRTHRPTIMLAIPSMYNAILHTKSSTPEDFQSIRLAGSGGEALPVAVYEGFKERLHLNICEGYGLTETSPVTNWIMPDENKYGSVGLPVKDLLQRIVNEEEVELSYCDDGEIRMKGPNIMAGYFNMPKETAEAFDDQGYFKTGDMGQIDEDGFLYITGRIKEMLIIGGENVFPREIEEALTDHEDVIAAGVVGRQDSSRGEVAVAFIEFKEDATFDEQKLRSWCREKIAPFKVPKTIIVLPELPRNPTGKIMRRDLTKLLETEIAQ
jgi:long-chain acyl-CoA synthetase